MTNALPAASADVSARLAETPGSVDIVELQRGEEQAWDDFVRSSPSGSFFHLAGWKSVVERVLGRKCFYLTARRNGRITGALPISRARSRLFGDCLVSLPLAVYGGICA